MKAGGGQVAGPRLAPLCQLLLGRAGKVTVCAGALESALWMTWGFQGLAPGNEPPRCPLSVEGGARAGLGVISLYSPSNPLG